MTVVERSPADLKPYERNPRKIPQRSIDAVKASIEKYGWRQPLVVDGENVIVAGHVRHRAALDLELEFVPVVFADDLSPEDLKAYRIDDNKVAELSGWNLDLLAGELDGLNPIGFTADELEVLKAAADESGENGSESGRDDDQRSAGSSGAADESAEGGPDSNADDDDPGMIPVTVNVRADRVWEARPKLEELARSFD